MTQLDQNQIAYLKNVLGVDSIVFDQAPSPIAMESAIRISRCARDAKLIVLLASDNHRLPLEGEAKPLFEKMIQAMKLDLSDLTVVEWPQQSSAGFLKDILNESSPAPVLAFGETSAASIALTSIGEIRETGTRKALATHSLPNLLAKPELKKETWSHLQKLMKVLR